MDTILRFWIGSARTCGDIWTPHRSRVICAAALRRDLSVYLSLSPSLYINTYIYIYIYIYIRRRLRQLCLRRRRRSRSGARPPGGRHATGHCARRCGSHALLGSVTTFLAETIQTEVPGPESQDQAMTDASAASSVACFHGFCVCVLFNPRQPGCQSPASMHGKRQGAAFLLSHRASGRIAATSLSPLG